MSKDQEDPDILPEYDFADGVQGKYAERFAAGTNLIRLDSDLLDVFPDAESVNQALRGIAETVRSLAKTGNGKP